MKKLLSETYKWTLILALVFYSSLLKAQSCSFTASLTKICLGNTTTLSPSYSGGSPTRFEWDFGDGKKDTVQSPAYRYTSPGTYVINLKITFSNGQSCVATGLTVKVFALPLASLTLESTPVQCFDGNLFCFKDRSQASSSPIWKRTLLFGDGAANVGAPIAQKDFCHRYGAIGTFSPVLEVVDTNNCISRTELKNAVTVAPDVYPSFKKVITGKCGTINVDFYNDTLTQRSLLKKFIWDFGDGTYDSSSWLSVSHAYNTPGVYTARLIFISTAGCIDTFSSNILNAPAPNFNMGISIIPNPVCYINRTSVKLISHDTVSGTEYTWTIRDPYNNLNSSQYENNVFLNPTSVTQCGNYPVRLKMSRDGCDTLTAVDTLRVLGPTARLKKGGINIVNKYQCSSTDTIYAPPFNQHFSVYCSDAIKFFWDFGDVHAPQCTTNTKAGVNTGQNCNFSVDSINVKHKYKAGEEDCYVLKMTLRDTITGCWDFDTTKIVIWKPDAHGIELKKPNPQCLGDWVFFDFDKAKPLCEKQEVWILPDSMCPNAQWKAMAAPYSWFYSATCSPSRWVTVGFAIRNGNCYDTVWYHNMLYFKEFRPDLLSLEQRSCDSVYLRLSFLDSTEKDFKWISWDFGDGTIHTDTLDSNYTFLPARSHTYRKPGFYNVVVQANDVNGCGFGKGRTVVLGFMTKMGPVDSVLCSGEETQMLDTVRYYHPIFTIDPRDYWREGGVRPEKLYWDFGEGNGYSDSGATPFHRYQSPGVYTVKMVAKDMFQCTDTTSYNIRVIGTKADFSISDTLLICGQIVRFYDSSEVIAPGVTGLDSIVEWHWDFGDLKTPSYLQNPYHDYTSFGTFNITLIATNTLGCTDTFSRSLRIKGPQPSCEIIGDTLGCVPFTARFRNTSTDTKYWVWSYGDSTVFSSTTNADVQHTFTKPGIYEISLFGVDSFLNPVTGNLYFCSATYPDPLSNQKKIKVYVFPLPPVDFEFTQPVCVGQPVVFKNKSGLPYTLYKWFMPSGDSVQAAAPTDTASYVFQQAGSYSVTYKPDYNPVNYPYCPQTISKTVQVTEVKADFDIDETLSKAPVFYFKNQSQGATSYLWDFGHPASGSFNTSTMSDASHDYTPDTGYFKVCLAATNIAGCIDTICKIVHNDFTPALIIPNVFTPGYNDMKNDAFDIWIIGEQLYNLRIYNRWGQLVFEGRTDGDQNDGVNWNGRVMNSGEECPSGTYYFIFEYSFDLRQKNKVVTGPLTLIRDEGK